MHVDLDARPASRIILTAASRDPKYSAPPLWRRAASIMGCGFTLIRT
jgi:hypothetical protein